MIDLTPLDVRKKRGDFRRGLRGYDPEEVDTFMDLVAERFEELVRENLSLTEKAGRLESQLQALESRESAVQEALVTAQKLREDVQDQSRKDAKSLTEQAERDAELLKERALREAELLKLEAEGEIARRLGEAESLILERQRALEELDRNRLKFLKGFRGLLEREMDAVEVEEARRPLEDTPLDLDFRSWKPAEKESGAEAGAAGEPDEDAGAPSGFESQFLAVADVPDEPPEADSVPEAEPVPEAEDVQVPDAPSEEETSTQLDEVEALVQEAGAAAEEAEAFAQDPVAVEVEDEADGEWEAGLVVSDETGDLSEGEAFQEGDHPSSDEEGASGGVQDPYDVADLAPDDPGSEPDPEPNQSGQEPKWLFSLLKREEKEREGEG